MIIKQIVRVVITWSTILLPKVLIDTPAKKQPNSRDAPSSNETCN